MTNRTALTKEIFFAVLDVDPSRRDSKLEELCGRDRELADEVRALLAAHTDSAEFLERPIYSQARERIGLAVGDLVGPYRLERVLGEGGMGVVFLAEQAAPMKRQVALKVIKPGMDSARVMARFEAERQTLALMSHAGIASVYDAGSTERGYPFFVMEFVDGVSLLEWCETRSFGFAARVELFLEVCAAIQHAHRKGVLHRDIKPSNLLVCDEGGRATIKVIDFGVAKALVQGEDDGLTKNGMVVGTPEYMSPEQADQAEVRIDTRSDVYSLGVVLFELLTGALPIDVRQSSGAGFTEIRRRITGEEPQRASAFDPALRGDLDWILARCLRKDPEDRYESVSDLAVDLRRHLSDEPISAGPVSKRRELGRLVRRHRALVVGTFAVIATLALGLAGSLWQGNRARRAEAGLLRLSDGVTLERSVDLLATLPFHAPEHEADLRSLDAVFAELRSHLPAFEARLAELGGDSGGLEQGLDAALAQLTWERRMLQELVDGLRKLDSSDPAISARTAASRRADWARDSAAESLERFADLWSDARQAIAESSRYYGLGLEPQVGLVPIGPDPQTDLWEFWHPMSGQEPRRGEDGLWRIDGETGMVFVLIPPGEFLMGARPPEPTDLPGTPNVDPDVGPDEGPVHEMIIEEPFFLSKYEMTQGQWLRLSFRNPSVYGPEFVDRVMSFDLSHPVDSVSWEEADDLLSQLGMSLPTEAQWEYAARAGSGTAFTCGWNPACLEGKANVRDLSTLETNLGALDGGRTVPWNDGFPFHAPVGSFEPNAFGLHDVHGNLFEWVLEPLTAYGGPTDPRDGRRRIPEGERSVLARGGSCVWLPIGCRVTQRAGAPWGSRAGEHGVRPSRALSW